MTVRLIGQLDNTLAGLITTCGLPANEARVLIGQALGVTSAWLLAHDRDPLEPVAAARIGALLARRRAGEPVAYITGEREFYGLSLHVTPAVLIPRPETELVVELAIERLPRGGRLIDLGTGSGAIAVAIAVERPDARIVAIDVSPAALALASRNAIRHHTRIDFRASDWFVALGGEHFDLIVANPPYVALGDPHLAEGDLRFEPAAALVAGEDGLAAIRRIIAGAPAHLGRGGCLILEHGHDQGPRVRALFAAAGWAEVESHTDLAGHGRVSLARVCRR